MVLSSLRDAGGAKIVALESLGTTIAALKADGKKIVLAHGVFDLLHVGHIRHLREAKSLGDILVVTLTEDSRVNKGPGRPAFPENLRAEALAALEAVDFVAISRYPTAVPVIATVQPDLYVKGPDYKDAARDVTGGISEEEAAVVAAGGALYITEDVAFSSSTLINKYFPSYSSDVQAYLAAFKKRHSGGDVLAALDKLRTMNVVVAGEAILDEYVYCDQMGKSAKEPVLAMRYARTETYAGGALAVANHLAEFCQSVELITYLGDSDANEKFVRQHLKPNVRANFVYKKDSPTILKRRYVEQTLGSKLFEVYVINDEPLDGQDERDLCAMIEARIGSADAIIASDFGHGLLTGKAKQLLCNSGKFLAVNTQINAANIRFHAISSYPRADYVCVNEGELRLDARNRHSDIADLVSGLAGKLMCERFLVTQGSAGVSYFDAGTAYRSPALATSVKDRIGSGDAVLALTSMCVASGMPPDMVAFVANVIGAQAVEIMGNATSIQRVPTLKFIDTLLK
jgi:rfaE bifunctional protein kinase chain/domain/rfaE bifunctional protein nucleotidyltransferase chain/domain